MSRTSASDFVDETSPVLAVTYEPALTAPSTNVAVLSVEKTTVPAPEVAGLLVATVWLAPSVNERFAVSVASDVAGSVAWSCTAVRFAELT